MVVLVRMKMFKQIKGGMDAGLIAILGVAVFGLMIVWGGSKSQEPRPPKPTPTPRIFANENDEPFTTPEANQTVTVTSGAGEPTATGRPIAATPTDRPSNLPPAQQPNANECDASINKHAFGFGRRLEVVNPCVRVRGRVVRRTIPHDGDYNLNISVDPEYRQYVSNVIELHTETICFTNNRIQNSTRSCAGYTSPPSLRPDVIRVGDYIEVMGPHVIDHTHGDGKEIHPVNYIRKL